MGGAGTQAEHLDAASLDVIEALLEEHFQPSEECRMLLLVGL